MLNVKIQNYMLDVKYLLVFTFLPAGRQVICGFDI